jgi:hypothetical protein
MTGPIKQHEVTCSVDAGVLEVALKGPVTAANADEIEDEVLGVVDRIPVEVIGSLGFL